MDHIFVIKLFYTRPSATGIRMESQFFGRVEELETFLFLGGIKPMMLFYSGGTAEEQDSVKALEGAVHAVEVDRRSLGLVPALKPYK